MKKIYLKITLATLLPLSGFADGTGNAPSPKDWPFAEYHNRIVVFNPLHQAYERIKPNAFYVGIEGWLLPLIFHSGNAEFLTTLGEVELRMGYNFFYNGRDHFTPVIGGGFFKDFAKYRIKCEHGIPYCREDHHYQLPGLAYGTIGFLYDHEFNSIFTLGTNLKGIIGGSTSSKHLHWGSTVLGFEIALPITFRFGYKRHWDFRIELFDIYLHGSDNSRNYVGSRNTIGYRF